MRKTSIIITTHNRPALIPRAVDSARTSGTDVEIVVVDDASHDETAKVCKQLPDIRYVRVERNQRVAGARNIGILASSGEYLSFLDDDDVRLPGSLDLQVQALQAVPQAGMVYGQALIGDQGGKLSGRVYPQECPEGDIFWELLGRNFVPCGGVVFRRSCLYRIGLLDDAIPGLDDWDLWIRIAELYPVLSVKQPVTIWRRSTPGSGQGTSRASQLVRQNTRQFRERWMNLSRAEEAPREFRREVWRRFSGTMARHLLWETARSLKAKRVRQAFGNMFAAMRLFPIESVKISCDHAHIRLLIDNYIRQSRNDGWACLAEQKADKK
jgi:glycosyltransferase involved in cell wall biosynthesis